jgi:hypothetical protein
MRAKVVRCGSSRAVSVSYRSSDSSHGTSARLNTSQVTTPTARPTANAPTIARLTEAAHASPQSSPSQLEKFPDRPQVEKDAAERDDERCEGRHDDLGDGTPVTHVSSA